MGFFGIGGSKNKDDGKSVQRSMDSVAVAKKRMNKSRSQRDAEEAEWAADEAELAQIEAEEKAQANQAPESISTYNPSANPAKPAVKSAMKKKSKFVDGQGMIQRSFPVIRPGSVSAKVCCTLRAGEASRQSQHALVHHVFTVLVQVT